MALSYKRMTEEQDKMRNVFEKGEYPFTVKAITEKPCKNQVNTMLVVELEVMNHEGRVKRIPDWIVLDMEDMQWKFRHFADSCGLIDLYDAENLQAKDFLGKNGVAKITIDEYEKDGEIFKNNKVADYIKSGKVKSHNDKDAFIDDPLPF